ncbi:unnamed protein product [Closterium sp. NIES-65]|nr:unnamed protein product [Closterium sp. NIES-65]
MHAAPTNAAPTHAAASSNTSIPDTRPSLTGGAFAPLVPPAEAPTHAAAGGCRPSHLQTLPHLYPAPAPRLQEERSLRLSRQQKRERMLLRAAPSSPHPSPTRSLFPSAGGAFAPPIPPAEAPTHAAAGGCRPSHLQTNPPSLPPPAYFYPPPAPPLQEERSLRLSRQQKRQRMLQRAAAALPTCKQTPHSPLPPAHFYPPLAPHSPSLNHSRPIGGAFAPPIPPAEAPTHAAAGGGRPSPAGAARLAPKPHHQDALMLLEEEFEATLSKHGCAETSSSSLTPPNIFLSYPSPSPPSSPFSKPLDLPTLKSALHALNFATAAAAGAASEAAGGAGAGAAGGAPSLRARRATGVTPITTRFTRTSSDFSLSAFLPPVSPPFPVQCSKPLDLATLKSALHAQNFATAAAAGAAGTGAAGGAPSLRARRATGIAPITTRFTRTSSDFSLAALTPPPKPLPLLSFPTLPLPSPSFPLFPVQQATGPSNTKDDAESDANDLPNLTPGSAARSGGAKPVNHPGQEARSSTATSIVALHTHHPRHALSSHASARPPIRLASFLSSVFRSAARGPSIASGTACLDLKERSVAELEAMPWSQLEPTIKTWLRDANILVEAMPWSQLEPTIKTWLRDANILIRVLLEGERLLCEAVLEDAPELDAGGVYRQLLSASLCVEGSVGKLAGTARSIAGLTRSPEKVFSFMEMFRAATGLREQVQSVLIAAAGVGGGSLWPQWQALPALLACAVFETIDELNSTLRHVDGLTPAAMPSPVAPKKKLLSRIISWKAQEVKSQSGEDVDVSVHAVTSYVVNYIGQLLDRTSRANYCAVLEEIYQSHGADHLKEPSSNSSSSSQHPGHAPQTPVQGAAGTPKEAAPLQYAAPAAAAAAAVATPDVPSNFPTALESAPAAAAPAAATAAAAAAAAGTPKEKARDSQNALGGGGGSSGGGSTSGGRKGRGVGGRQRKRQLGADMEALLDALYFNMEARGRTIADGPLSALFVLNNANYIASSISSGRMRDAIRHSDRLADYESAFERAALCKLLACLEPLEVSAKMSGDGVKQRQIWLYACKNVIVSPSTSLIHPLAHLSESPSTFRLPKPRGLKRFNAVFDEEVALEQRLRLELLCLHAPIDASLHNHIYACSTIPCSLKRFNAVFEEVALEQRRWLVLSDSCRKAMRVRFAKVIKGSYMDFLTPHR